MNVLNLTNATDSCQELLSYYPGSRQAPEIVRTIQNVIAAPGVVIDSCQELLSYYPGSRQAPEIVRTIQNVIRDVLQRLALPDAPEVLRQLFPHRWKPNPVTK